MDGSEAYCIINVRHTTVANFNGISIENFYVIDLSFGNAYLLNKKPNHQPMYINKMSNHHQTIKNEFPKMINRRLYEISCSNCEFEKHKQPYEQALKSGYTENLAYSKPINRNKKKDVGKEMLFGLTHHSA